MKNCDVICTLKVFSFSKENKKQEHFVLHIAAIEHIKICYFFFILFIMEIKRLSIYEEETAKIVEKISVFLLFHSF